MPVFFPGSSSLSVMLGAHTIIMPPCYRKTGVQNRRETSWPQSSPCVPRKPAGLPRGGITKQKSLGWVRRAGLQSLRAGASILSSSHLPLLSGRVWPSVHRPWCWADLCESELHASGQVTSLSVPAAPSAGREAADLLHRWFGG